MKPSDLLKKVITNFPEKLARYDFYNKRYNLYCAVGHLAKEANLFSEEQLGNATEEEYSPIIKEAVAEQYDLPIYLVRQIVNVNDLRDFETTKQRAKRVRLWFEGLIKQAEEKGELT